MKHSLTLKRTAEYTDFNITSEELNGKTLEEWIEEQLEDNWQDVQCQRFGGDVFNWDELEVNGKDINLHHSIANQLEETSPLEKYTTSSVILIPVKFMTNPEGKSIDMTRNNLEEASRILCKEAFYLGESTIDNDTLFVEAYHKDGKYEHAFGWSEQIQTACLDGWEDWANTGYITVYDLVPVRIHHNYNFSDSEYPLFKDAIEGVLKEMFVIALKDFQNSMVYETVQLTPQVDVALDLD